VKITVCPNCGSREIKKVRRNWTGKAQGKTYLVPALEYYDCPSCGEKVYDRWAIQKIESYSPVLSKKRAKRTKRRQTPSQSSPNPQSRIRNSKSASSK
jgi:YgiT-type zinc finger domain-containing protein